MESFDHEDQAEGPEEEVDEDEVPLEHWAFGNLFGVKSTGQLDLIPVADMEKLDLPLPDQPPPQLKKDKPTKKAKEKKSNTAEVVSVEAQQENTIGIPLGCPMGMPLKDLDVSIYIQDGMVNLEVLQPSLYVEFPHDKSEAGRRAGPIAPDIQDIVMDHLRCFV